MKSDKEIYSKEELSYFEEIENDDAVSMPREEFEREKERFEMIARNHTKRKAISIRVFERDIDRLKALAMAEGIPYQTYITSILHKAAWSTN